ncbi:SdrD B-like domain-containing protein, partial [Okeania sp. SIO2B3]|uniref:SdrD B-like domain-containing protein n=1 Tax=Okeania sp. SIO2B3 TaxID=2607784 RepID=UPI0013C29D69
MDKIEAAADVITSDSLLDMDLEDNNIEEVSGLTIQDPSGIGVNGEIENEFPAADNTPIAVEPLVLAEGQQVFDFDEISDTFDLEQFGGQQIGDFFWSESWGVIHRDHHPGSGYENGTVSPPYTGFNWSALPVSITSEEDFTFNSAYLTSAWTDGMNIEVIGLNDGVQLYSETVNVSTSGPTLFDFNFINVDEIQFSSFSQFVIDDLVYTPEDQEPGSISGYKWNDLDGDGIWDDNEQGLEGWTIYIDENNNGELDDGEMSTVTDGDGYYSFDDLSPGTYTIAEELQPGWEQTYPGSGDGETVIIDFESLKHEDANTQDHGFNYEEDGFVLDNLSQPFPFA